MLSYSAWSSGAISLSNSGDDLLILNSEDLPVDALSWGSSSSAFDPSVADVAEGHSLARLPAGQDSARCLK